jgi:hypothetical protein
MGISSQIMPEVEEKRLDRSNSQSAEAGLRASQPDGIERARPAR